MSTNEQHTAPSLSFPFSSERGVQADSAPPSPSLSSAPALPSLYARSPGQMAAPRLPSIPSLLNTPLSATSNHADFPLLPTSAATGSQAGAPPTGSLDANLRQLALLQALVARQQALVESASAQGRSTPTSYSSTSRLGGHSEGGPTSVAGAAAASFDNSLMGNDWNNVVEGLNHSTSTSTDISAQGSPNPVSGIVGLGGDWSPAGVTANELAVAQQQLDLWSQTVFTTDSPAQTQPSTPAATPSSPPAHGAHLLHHHHQSQQHHPQSNTPFDWNTLYSPPSQHHPHGYTTLPPSSNAFAAPSAQTSDHHYRANGLARGLPDDSDSPPAVPHQAQGRRGSTSIAAAASSGGGRNHSGSVNGGVSIGGAGMNTRGGGRRGSSRTVKYVEEDDDVGDEEMDPGPLQNGTPEEIEEDKRRRNTAASARFRAKKKQRDQQLQQTSVQLREKVLDLEKEKTSLKAENTWLRDLVSERSEISPKIRELLISQQQGH